LTATPTICGPAICSVCPHRAHSFSRKGSRAIAESRDRKPSLFCAATLTAWSVQSAADAIRECYDDGLSMERPALQKPLDYVYARRIDVIVVYKVDRLTCALAELA
jgi:hypothetical protein